MQPTSLQPNFKITQSVFSWFYSIESIQYVMVEIRIQVMDYCDLMTCRSLLQDQLPY